ncbi:hypothetical protein AC1031_003869 [Aphanomyces cochlioides]|nr:hypothetical protein AC1031_003869 [Aphanomyces cochlioides]
MSTGDPGHVACLKQMQAPVNVEIDGKVHQFLPTDGASTLIEASAFCGRNRIPQLSCGALVAEESRAKLLANGTLDDYLKCRGYHDMEGHTSLFPVSVDILHSLVAPPANIQRAMQVGFNAGHSAMTLLRANPKMHLTSFDVAFHPYVFASAAFLDVVFPGRHTLIPGDSTISIPDFESDTTFDFIFIDGGHSYEVASADLRNCRRLARAGTIVVMDDVTGVSKSYWTAGPTQAWDEAIASGLVVEVGRIESSRGGNFPSWLRTSLSKLDVGEPQGTDGLAFGFYTGHVQTLLTKLQGN